MTLHHVTIIDMDGTPWQSSDGLVSKKLAKLAARKLAGGRVLLATDEATGAVVAGQIERGNIVVTPQLDENGQRVGFDVEHGVLGGAEQLTVAALTALVDTATVVTAVDKPLPTAAEIALGELRKTDRLMPRALEDLYTLLLSKAAFGVAEMPPAVRAVYTKRRAARALLP